ncbi:rna-directed dna polymerase from mobile element jockey- hypothetical protein [Limosa lapponica baueri]|uniref:Endonuclease/exonuclease/phosphatase domain-containing protein n=1 Tax=Limosa lapponica baueri TaxID=1758121 RepID=A0A2I0TCJ9_LIMLA|nr:rna-directed dna polymerase from mobile element jockey- hypothetical protein [Limosa lapponica baueri]
MGVFNYPSWYPSWWDNTAPCKQSRTFMKCINDNFLTQVIEQTMRRGGLLDLVPTNKEGPIGNVKIKSSLSCSDHQMLDFRICRGGKKAFYDGMTGCVDEGRALDIVYPNFSKAFDAVSHNILKMCELGLGGRVQRSNAHTTATNRGISQANHSSKKCPLAASQDENQTIDHFKGMYTNVHSLGKKQEELELYAQSESYDIIGITETCWDNSHNWRIMTDGYRLYRKDSQGRKGGLVVLYVKENLECIEVNYSKCGRPIECLWVKIRGVAFRGNLTLVICYLPPNQHEKASEALFGSLKQALGQQNLILIGDFNYLGIVGRTIQQLTYQPSSSWNA